MLTSVRDSCRSISIPSSTIVASPSNTAFLLDLLFALAVSAAFAALDIPIRGTSYAGAFAIQIMVSEGTEPFRADCAL